MAFELFDMVIDRVDFVDEGANSASFIELYKRKENSDPMDVNEIISKLKPEHAEVINKALNDSAEELDKAKSELADKEKELGEANEELAKAKSELEQLNADKVTKSAEATEEELMKSMPEAARELFLKMRAQKEAAEEQIRKSAEEKVEAEAIAKADSLKAIPVEQEKLVGILKSYGSDVYELLSIANTAIEEAVLGEVGKNRGNGAAGSAAGDAWSQIEKRAAEIAKRDGITIEKATATAISENPELYEEYLKEVR